MSYSFMIDNQELVLRWLETVHNYKISPPCVTIGIVDENTKKMVGVAVFNNFESANIELSCVGKGVFNRQVCKMLAKVAFDDNNCERITVRIRADNEYALKVAKKFGWKYEGTMRNYYRDGHDRSDCIVMGMLKQECRF